MSERRALQLSWPGLVSHIETHGPQVSADRQAQSHAWCLTAWRSPSSFERNCTRRRSCGSAFRGLEFGRADGGGSTRSFLRVRRYGPSRQSTQMSPTRVRGAAGRRPREERSQGHPGTRSERSAAVRFDCKGQRSYQLGQRLRTGAAVHVDRTVHGSSTRKLEGSATTGVGSLPARRDVRGCFA